MVGGAEMAELTLTDEGAPGGEAGPGGQTSGYVGPTSTPAKFIGFKPTFASIKSIISTYKQLERPTKKDLKLAASEIFDIYSYATPQARGMLNQSVPLNGFVEELGQVVSLNPVNARTFFDSLVNLITEMVPDAETPTPVLNAQNKGSGKSGCGCCTTCGGAEPDKKDDKKDGKKPLGNQPLALEAPNDKPSSLAASTTGNAVINNVLNWIKQKRESIGESQVPAVFPVKTLEQQANKINEQQGQPAIPVGKGKTHMSSLIERAKEMIKMNGGAYSRTQRKQLLPGRMQNTQARLIMSEMPSDEEPSSDEEMTGGIYNRKRRTKTLLPGRIQKLRAKLAKREMEEDDEEMTGGRKKGTNKRAEIVKRVMKERGVKMIEASKIVKSEGLY